MIEPNAFLLIVDGDEARQTRLSSMLDRYTHRHTVNTPAEALHLAENRRLDLVIMAVEQQDGSSTALLDGIRATLKNASTPVLIYGTEADEPQIAACLGAQGTDLVMLPTTRLEFNSRVNNLLHQRALEKRISDLVNVVIPIGIQLSAERDFDRLLETILIEAKELANADAGTLYLRTSSDTLRFVILRNDSLGMAMGGSSEVEIDLPEIPLYEADGAPNMHNVATHTALTTETVNIQDAYEAEGFDFSGTKSFDERTGYRSKSFLTIPLLNSANHVIGVLQLINARSAESGEIIPFDRELHPIIESMAGLATVALEATIREERLRRQIADLRIEIDEKRREQDVERITDTQYFRKLRDRAKDFRKGRGDTDQ